LAIDRVPGTAGDHVRLTLVAAMAAAVKPAGADGGVTGLLASPTVVQRLDTVSARTEQAETKDLVRLDREYTKPIFCKNA